MAERVLIAQNISREGPGLIEEVLQKEGLPYTIIDLSLGETIPDPSSFDILIVMGGPDSANDTTEKMQDELAKIQAVVEAGIPFLGICLGMQVLVKAMGGEVMKAPVKEIGFRDQAGGFNAIRLTAQGIADPLFAGLGESFKVFHLHGETVTLTNDMELLGEGHDVPNQVIKVGERAYGIQCHFEITAEELQVLLHEDADLQQADQSQIRNDFTTLREEYEQAGMQLIRNFLALAT